MRTGAATVDESNRDHRRKNRADGDSEPDSPPSPPNLRLTRSSAFNERGAGPSICA
jgi:hypothetical protein